MCVEERKRQRQSKREKGRETKLEIVVICGVKIAFFNSFDASIEVFLESIVSL